MLECSCSREEAVGVPVAKGEQSYESRGMTLFIQLTPWKRYMLIVYGQWQILRMVLGH